MAVDESMLLLVNSSLADCILTHTCDTHTHTTVVPERAQDERIIKEITTLLNTSVVNLMRSGLTLSADHRQLLVDHFPFLFQATREAEEVLYFEKSFSSPDSHTI